MFRIIKKVLFWILIASLLVGCSTPTPLPTLAATTTLIPQMPTPSAPAPTVTLTPVNPAQVNALLDEIKAMDDRVRSEAFISFPGWVYFPANYNYAQPESTYPLGSSMPKSFQRDDYYLQDASGKIIQMVSDFNRWSLTQTLVTTYRDGVYRDFPGGKATQKDAFAAPVFSPDYGFYDLAVLGVKRGDTLSKDPPDAADGSITYRLTGDSRVTEAAFDPVSGRLVTLSTFDISSAKKQLTRWIKPISALYSSPPPDNDLHMLWQPYTPAADDLQLTLLRASQEQVSGVLTPNAGTGDISPLSLGDASAAELVDSLGHAFPLSPLRELPISPSFDQVVGKHTLQFTLQPAQSQALPSTATLSIQSAVVETHPQEVFTFDSGASPQVGQIWQLNQALTVAGHAIKLLSAQWIDHNDGVGPLFTFESGDGVESIGLADFAHITVSVDQASSAGQMTAGVYYAGGSSIPAGPLQLTIDRLAYRLSGPWSAVYAGSGQAASTPTLTPTPLPSGNTAFNLQAQAGGSVGGVALLGDTAYVGIGPRLAAVDVHDPAAPRLLAQSPVLAGQVSGVLLISGGPAPHLVVSAGKHLVSLTVSANGGIRVDGETVLPGRINAMLLEPSIGRLYTGGAIYQSTDPNSGEVTSGYVAVFDLSSGGNPRLLVKKDLSLAVQCLALGKTGLFAGLSQAGAGKGIVSMPRLANDQLGQPVVVIPASDASSAASAMQVSGDRLYVSTDGTLIAYDIKDPAAPQEKWRAGENAPAGLFLGPVRDFMLLADRIDVVTNGCVEACVVANRLASFTPPEPVSAASTAVSASMVASSPDRLLLASDGLEIYGYAQDRTLQRLGAYYPDLAVVSSQVAVGDYLYTFDENSAGETPQYLHVLRLSDLTVVAELRLDLSRGDPFIPNWCRGIAQEGDRLYIYGYRGAWVFDIHDPRKPVQVDRPPMLNVRMDAGAAADIGGRRILFLSLQTGAPETLSAFDVTDVTQIKSLSSLPFQDDQVSQMVWSGTRLYVLTGQGQLYVISLVNAALKVESPRPNWTVPSPQSPRAMTCWRWPKRKA